MSDHQWVDDFIDRLEEAAQGRRPLKFNDDTGKEVLVEIKNELVDLVKDNRSRLQRIGKQTFKEFLLLWHKQQEFEALVKIYETLDNSELIEQYKEDTAKLAEIAKETQADRDFWIDFGKKVGMRIVFGALGAII